MIGRSEVTIDLQRIVENYRIYKSHIFPHQRVMAVVKADAYGHGSLCVATVLARVGVRDFAVATLDEAIELRRGGIDGQILILGYTPPYLSPQIAEFDLTQTLYSEEYAGSLYNVGKRIKAHVAIETGMNRIGFDTHDSALCAEKIRTLADRFDITGIYTHLSCSDDELEENFTRDQIERYFNVAARLSDARTELHFANSAAGIRYNDSRCSLIRLGIMLYGLKPSRRFELPSGILPSLEWHSVVASLRIVERGESIGYGRSYVAQHKMHVATVPTGYADGYFRSLSNRGFALIGSRRVAVVGKVCMDQLMIDVSDVPCVAIGDCVTLIGDGYTAEDMAHDAGTINYEIVTNIAPRVTKTYIKG